MKRVSSQKQAPYQDPLKYLRRHGNRRVRAQRRRRSALRLGLMLLLWSSAAVASTTIAVLGVLWVEGPDHLLLQHVTVRGLKEARTSEVLALVEPWLGRNVLNMDLDGVEKQIRKHPWIGSTGNVRIKRRLPDSLLVTIEEREPAGLALVNGFIVLLDTNGSSIDRFGPRYAQYDFPIIKGLDSLVSAAALGEGARLTKALRLGVDVTRTLARRASALYMMVSEIDVSNPSMVILRVEGQSYDLRLSRDDYLRNMDHYFALKGNLESRSDVIEYVDLRWEDRIAVSPAAMYGNQHGGR